MKYRLPIHRPEITKEDIGFVSKTLGDAQISGRAPVVSEFENAFATFVGLKHAVAVSSGTAALHVALLACGVSRGDRVVQPCLTMMATAFAASYIGAGILPVDVEQDYWCIDQTQIPDAMKGKPKAIIAVHLYGNPARVDEIGEIARSRGTFLIEDCAEALGARLNDKQVGTFGDVAAFSFFSNKLITTGEGGMIATNNEEIAAQARRFRDLCFGKTNKFLHDGLGYNYRMSAMQASLGLSQLGRVEDLIRRKSKVAEEYNRELSGMGIERHPERPNSFTLPWMYSILVPRTSRTNNLRDHVMQDLTDSGIETRPFFVPLHRQPVYAQEMEGLRFPVSEDLSSRGINLPSSLDLRENEISAVATTLKSSIRTRLG
jgi:perosamine synthetase